MNELFEEFRELFLEEAEEYIAALNDNLIAIEKEPQNQKLIDNIFRIVHTMKSSAAAVGFQDLSTLSHKAEDIMQQIRSGEREITMDITNALFEVFDIIQNYIENIKVNKKPTADIDKMIKKLEEIHVYKSSDSKKKGKKDMNKEVTEIKFNEIILTEYDKHMISQAYKEGQKCYLIKVVIDERDPLQWLRADFLINNVKKHARIIKIIPEKEQFLYKDFPGIFCLIISTPADKIIEKRQIIVDLIKELIIEEYNPTGEQLVLPEKNSETPQNNTPQDSSENEKTQAENSEPPLPAADSNNTATEANASPASENNQFKIKSTGDTIRVGIRKLDNLMNLIGELVIITSGLKQIEQDIKNDTVNKNIFNKVNLISNKLTNISTELQNGIMETRMLPISNIFLQFNRVVRDLAKDENKEINLILKGEDTELDKKIIDEIGDPLMHLVRNAVDHAIKTPEERKQAGKPGAGTITLSAGQVSNHIELSIKDDGEGLDINKIKAQALKRGLATEDKLSSMDEAEIYDYIFLPGFSTADKVTSVSGRGVGLDVVKNVINLLGGSVDVFSKKGKGTEFIITIPLTLAITSVILIESNSVFYAIPINDINETLKIKPQEIKTIEGFKAINLRNTVLPLINLAEIFKEGEVMDWHSQRRISVIVVNYQNKKIGLIIDKILREQEIVIKPLERHYRTIKGLSGAAILGDGTVVLVIDVIGVIKLMRGIEKIAHEQQMEVVA